MDETSRPTTVYLDGNIFDKLAADTPTLEALQRLVAAGKVRVIGTPVVAGEISASHFGGFPDWFPVAMEPECVAVLGYARLGMARLGKGETYKAHRGDARSDSKTRDAIIAQSAESLADLFVSEDNRSRNRLLGIARRCRALTFDDFAKWVRATSQS